MRKQYTIVALLLILAMVMTGCSWDDLKEKFVGSEGSGVTGPAAASDAAVLIENYDPLECVTLGEYKGVEVDCTVTEDEMKQETENLLMQFSTVEEIKKGKCKSGQSVNIDYTGKIDGKEVDGETAQDDMIVLGSSGHADGFDDGIVGMEPGKKKEIKLKLPEDYQNSEIAGKEIVYNIKLNYIAGETKTPKLTDSFVKENTRFKTVKEFKKEMKIALGNQKKENAATTALNTIVEKSTVNRMPQTLKEAHKQQTDHSYRFNMAQYYGETDFDVLLGNMGMTKDAYEQQLETAGENNAKIQLVFEAIAEKENIQVTEEEIQAYANNAISSAGASGTLDDFKKQYETTYGKAVDFDSFLRTSCVYDKVMSFLEGSLKIKE